MHRKMTSSWALAAGFVAAGPDGEARLLALTREGGFAALTAVTLSSGAQTGLWREAETEPLTLLPVGSSVFLVHRNGVVRLSEGR